MEAPSTLKSLPLLLLFTVGAEAVTNPKYQTCRDVSFVLVFVCQFFTSWISVIKYIIYNYSVNVAHLHKKARHHDRR